MSAADRIEELRQYPATAPNAFREQLKRARECQERMDGQVTPTKGIDRSGELTPILRPSIVRTLTDAS